MRPKFTAILILFVALPLMADHPLVLLVPDPVVVEATSREGAIVSFTVWPYGGRDPNPTVACQPSSGSLFPRGATTVHCVTQNSFGERAQGEVAVFVYDATSPVVQLPGRIVVTADGPDGKIVTFDVTAYDAIDGEVAVQCTPPSGSRFKIGLTTVDCVALDSSLNPGGGSFEVEVQKRGGPPDTLKIHVPDDIRVEAASPRTEIRYAVSASGTADPNPVITCAPASGSLLNVGTTIVQCSAADSLGNRAAGAFRVIVTDTTPPTLVASDIEVEAWGGGATLIYNPFAADLVDGIIPATCTPLSGSRFPIGNTTVTCSASDTHGNTTSATFLVTVFDAAAPLIASVRANPTVLEPVNHKLVDVTVYVDAVDATDGSPACSVTSIEANETITGPGSGNTDYDWSITGPLAVQLRAERNGAGSDRIYTIHVTCADRSGNSASGSVDVIVPKGGGSSGGPATVTTPGRRRSVRP